MLSRGRSAHQVGKRGIRVDQSLRCDGIVVVDYAWWLDNPGRETRNRGTGRDPDVCLDAVATNGRVTGIGNRLVGEDGEASCGTEINLLRLGVAGQSDAHKAKSCGTNE